MTAGTKFLWGVLAAGAWLVIITVLGIIARMMESPADADPVREHIDEHIAGLQSALTFEGQPVEDEQRRYIERLIAQYEADQETGRLDEECVNAMKGVLPGTIR